ncbi:hypothetical protein [Synechococcus sp. CS-205]|uniref:hypothetical protein n=1 Tax=Synechococcus sp. CS-205 TaxID=2847984 RepID=UPI00223B02BD|nr:hypothetical protein [Synechococcus sp. CS-205]MCT0248455.1 hypothetical protein [Synechococcus sp. CS-205]
MNRSSIALFLATAGLVAGVAGCGQAETPSPSSTEMEKPSMSSPEEEKSGDHDGMKPDEGGEGGEGG